jgi:hypothetical protein
VPNHRLHVSHRALLRRTRSRAVRSAPVDAIIVPSARPADSAKHAIDLAANLGCALIVLASKASDVDEVVARASRIRRDRLFVIDFPSSLPRPFPRFQTTKLLMDSELSRHTDVSAKRNVALAIARMSNLRRVFFLDDDMQIPNPRDLPSAAALLDEHDAVGLRIDGYPDNSVVCHANRETGGFQDTFVGGGALLVATDRICSFFPDIYNEDWFLLLDRFKLRPVTQAGRAVQTPYDPFALEERARAEELGDVLAEGIFGLLDDGEVIAKADKAYWQSFLHERRQFIDRMLKLTCDGRIADEELQMRMVRSLRAARDQLTRHITADLCVEFLDAWRIDLEAWGTFLSDLTPQTSIGAAIEELGLSYRTRPNSFRIPRVLSRPWPPVPNIAAALLSFFS